MARCVRGHASSPAPLLPSVAGRDLEGGIMIGALGNLFADEGGISAVEYAMLLAFIGAGLVAAMMAFSGETQNVMDTAANRIQGG